MKNQVLFTYNKPPCYGITDVMFIVINNYYENKFLVKLNKIINNDKSFGLAPSNNKM